MYYILSFIYQYHPFSLNIVLIINSWSQAEQHQRYGKIFKEKLGPNTQLHVADPDLFEEIYRNEGQYPERPPMQSWRLYRRVTGRPEGILTA